MTPEFLTHPTLAARHGFFTRRGGVSQGPYASLNASLSGGDDVDRVSRNRALVAEALGAQPLDLVGARQVHGTTVVTVQTPWIAGTGPDADGLVTSTPGIALSIITADCAPVLLQDAQASVIGAVHAGWRGAAAGVLEQAVAAMAALGATPSRIRAVIGPCIGPDEYEVGPDLRDAILPTLSDAASWFRPGRPPDRFLFDLPGYCLARLRAAGIRDAIALGLDTVTDDDRFFSHRRRTRGAGGPIGHQISAISL
jgi:YfiH family protein